jgi:hypothetical protein
MNPTSSSTTAPPTKTPEPPAQASKGSEGASFAETLSRAGAPPNPPPATPEPAPLALPLTQEAPGPATALEQGPEEAADIAACAPAEDPLATLAAHAPGENAGPQRSRARPDPLDPAARHAAQMGPLFTPPPGATSSSGPSTGTAPAEAQTHASMESMLPEMVRKIAWSGDGKRGSMRLELGAGALAGGTLVVHADEGRVRVELNAPTGTDVDAWKTRLEERLERRGVEVDEVVVS